MTLVAETAALELGALSWSTMLTQLTITYKLRYLFCIHCTLCTPPQKKRIELSLLHCLQFLLIDFDSFFHHYNQKLSVHIFE